MIVRVGVEDGLSILIDTDDDRGYSPDICDDICTRVRTLFRDAMADARAAGAEAED